LDRTSNFIKHLIENYNIDFIKLSEYADIPGCNGGYIDDDNKMDISLNDLDIFSNEMVDFCSNHDVRIEILSWDK